MGGGAGLNICSYNLIIQHSFFEHTIDTRNKITIKAYDVEESSSKGLVVLPIKVLPTERDTILQVLDLLLSYNILLGRLWIHEIQVVPSSYHQCIKFPYNKVEVYVLASSRHDCNTPKQFANTLVS